MPSCNIPFPVQPCLPLIYQWTLMDLEPMPPVVSEPELMPAMEPELEPTPIVESELSPMFALEPEPAACCTSTSEWADKELLMDIYTEPVPTLLLSLFASMVPVGLMDSLVPTNFLALPHLGPTSLQALLSPLVLPSLLDPFSLLAPPSPKAASSMLAPPDFRCLCWCHPTQWLLHELSSSQLYISLQITRLHLGHPGCYVCDIML